MWATTNFYYLAFACYGLAGIYIVIIGVPALMRIITKQPKTKTATGQEALINELVAKSDNYESAPGHARRVAEIAKKLAIKYGLLEDEINKLEIAALLHDIGQVGNYSFINQAGALSAEEMAELWEHPVLAEQILNQNLGDIGWAGRLIRWHHEAWDGTGYPDRLCNEHIPLSARILTVADAYDAMTHDRPYRKALSQEETVKELQLLAGTKFDPQVVQVVQVVIELVKT